MAPDLVTAVEMSSPVLAHQEKLQEVEDAIRRLKNIDLDWLHDTLRKREAHLAQHNNGDAASKTTELVHRDTDTQKAPATLLATPETDQLEVANDAVWPFDMTTPLQSIPPQLVTDYIRFLHDFDWASTEFGPMSTWDSNFRRKVNMCLSDKQAGILWIGPNFKAFYNEAYARIAGDNHPRCLGQPAHTMWGEMSIWEEFGAMLRRSYDHGVASASETMSTVASQHGQRAEIWASFSIIPLPNGLDGGVFGSYNTVSIITDRVVSSRRLTMLLHLIQTASHAENRADLWTNILAIFEHEIADIPFAALYAAEGRDGTSWTLQGAVGLPVHILPTQLDPQAARQDLSPKFDEAMAQGVPFVIDCQHISARIRAVIKSRTHGDSCQSVVLFPIKPNDEVLAFMMIGINPLAPYNIDYQQLMAALMRECTTALASLCLKEDQIGFAERLSKELQIKEGESQQMETRFRKMSDMSPVAMFHLSGSGKVLYANMAWRELTGVPVEDGREESWLKYVFEEDMDLTHDEFVKITQGQSVAFEMRWKRSDAMKKKSYATQDQLERLHLWTIASAYPEVDKDGQVTNIYGCLTDITPQKFMQEYRERELKDALELKRQQENFMDMISHELRNPMSAIVLTVESIAHELKSLQASDAVSRMEESTEIIMTCVQHQKRIVDDVLTLSKFDSGLLDICPVPVRLEDMLTKTTKLYDAELKKHDIAMDVVVDDSYNELGIGCLQLDPSRLQQVVMNLLTNAIKFTSTAAQRRISIVLSASTQRPLTSPRGCSYIEVDHVDQPDAIYPCIEVVDTGRGMTAEETAKLFHKFTQASAKTYAEYGGSGLGLFICKQLCHLQGGAIGVAAMLGQGTTFAFYVAASRCASVNGACLTELPLPSPQPQHDRPIFVLLVEDNLINQRVLRATLERANYEVYVANHGLEALDYIAQSTFSRKDGKQLDVVLLDIEMPICDGLECARKVREQEMAGTLTGHVPIIGVTANARAEQLQTAMDAGMDTVVTKPFKLQELVEKLRELNIYSDWLDAGG